MTSKNQPSRSVRKWDVRGFFAFWPWKSAGSLVFKLSREVEIGYIDLVGAIDVPFGVFNFSAYRIHPFTTLKKFSVGVSYFFESVSHIFSPSPHHLWARKLNFYTYRFSASPINVPFGCRCFSLIDLSCSKLWSGIRGVNLVAMYENFGSTWPRQRTVAALARFQIELRSWNCVYRLSRDHIRAFWAGQFFLYTPPTPRKLKKLFFQEFFHVLCLFFAYTSLPPPPKIEL